MNQLPFLYEFKTKNSTTLELQRQGLQFLQSLQNKKILILFTVTTKVNPYSFSSAFNRDTDPQSNTIHFNYPLSSITISRQIQLIQPNYILLVMNYCHKTPSSYLLLLYGYLISSVMLFHNEGELTMKSDIVELLSELQRIVEASNYKQVEESNLKMNLRGNTETYQESGESAHLVQLAIPDFYLVLHTPPPQTAKITIKNIFKDFSSSASSSTKQLERSVQALNYLFHTRRTQYVSLPNNPQFLKSVANIRSDILANINSKRFLGCQITGSIIKHLCCQFVIFHNEGNKQINFNDLQSKFCLDLIESQKQFGITSYIKKLSYRIRTKDLPVNKEEILLIHQTSIRETFEEFSATVKGGLNIQIEDFINLWKQILDKCGDHLNYLLEQNQKAINTFNESLVNNLVEVSVLPEKYCIQQLLQPSSCQYLLNILNIYLFKSVGHQSKQKFPQLSTPLLKRLLNEYQQTIRDNLKYIHELQTKNLVLSERKEHLEKQNLTIRQRIEQCYSEKEVTSYINESKESEDNSKEELLKKRIKYKSTISILQKEVHELEKKLSEETLKRKALEEDLIDVTERYQHIVTKQKSKASKPVTIIGQLSHDLKDSIQTFDKISNKVHKMQGMYKYAKQIVVQNKKLTQQIQKKVKANKELQDENKKLYSNIETYDSTIGGLEWNAECYKNNIKELQTETGVYKINMAEMDAKIQVYGKCLKLIKGYLKTGKHEQLYNFIKVSQHEDVRVQIQELFS